MGHGPRWPLTLSYGSALLDKACSNFQDKDYITFNYSLATCCSLPLYYLSCFIKMNKLLLAWDIYVTIPCILSIFIFFANNPCFKCLKSPRKWAPLVDPESLSCCCAVQHLSRCWGWRRGDGNGAHSLPALSVSVAQWLFADGVFGWGSSPKVGILASLTVFPVPSLTVLSSGSVSSA